MYDIFIVTLTQCPPYFFDSTPEYQSFKRTYKYIWGSVSAIIKCLEHLMLEYSVSLAYIDGQEVAALAKNDCQNPSLNSLLKCICNTDQILALIQIPGRRYIGIDADVAASIKIQSLYRGYRVHKLYRQHRRENTAALRIQALFTSFLQYKRTKRRIAQVQIEREAEWVLMQEKFKSEWEVNSIVKYFIVCLYFTKVSHSHI